MRAFFLITVATTALFTASVQAETIRADVKGMHCVACAQAIEAVVSEEKSVEKVSVDVKAGTATITEKNGQHLEDARVKTLVKEAGYSVTGITRSAQ